MGDHVVYGKNPNIPCLCCDHSLGIHILFDPRNRRKLTSWTKSSCLGPGGKSFHYVWKLCIMTWPSSHESCQHGSTQLICFHILFQYITAKKKKAHTRNFWSPDFHISEPFDGLRLHLNWQSRRLPVVKACKHHPCWAQVPGSKSIFKNIQHSP